MHMPDKQPIRVLSFDFDGCIYNSAYKNKIAEAIKPVMDLYYSIQNLESQKAKEKDFVQIHSLEAQIKELKQALKKEKAAFDQEEKYVTEANKPLLTALNKEASNYKKTIIMIGSNRQYKAADDCNSFKKKTQSCFHTIKALQKYLQAELNKFLLADIVPEQSEKEKNTIPHNGEYGTSYEKALHDDEPHPIARWDATKIALIYAQMHHVAKQHPEDQIEYFFYEDMNPILLLLEKWYELPDGGAQWIPSNVTLHVIEYDGGDPVVRLKQGPSKFPFNSEFAKFTGEILDQLALTEARKYTILSTDIPLPGPVNRTLKKFVSQNSHITIVPEANALEKTIDETEISPFPQNTNSAPSFFSPNNALEKGAVEGSPNTGPTLN